MTEGAPLIDVRQPDEYDAGHVPGARRISLAEVALRVGEVPRDEPVYVICQTGARSARAAQWYRAQGIDVAEVDRGGRVTYHGPGQLVGYPIMRVDDVIAFLRTMERAIIAALDGAGVAARSREAEGRDYTGVWVQDRKIASIGVHLSRGVSAHGFAVNVTNDLAPFSWVVACGLPSVRMTSMAAEGGPDDLARFRERMADAFCAAFGRRQRSVAPEELGVGTRPPVGTLG
jgi:lipoyl(octanoyl) transferase